MRSDLSRVFGDNALFCNKIYCCFDCDTMRPSETTGDVLRRCGAAGMGWRRVVVEKTGRDGGKRALRSPLRSIKLPLNWEPGRTGLMSSGSGVFAEE